MTRKMYSSSSISFLWISPSPTRSVLRSYRLRRCPVINDGMIGLVFAHELAPFIRFPTSAGTVHRAGRPIPRDDCCTWCLPLSIQRAALGVVLTFTPPAFLFVAQFFSFLSFFFSILQLCHDLEKRREHLVYSMHGPQVSPPGGKWTLGFNGIYRIGASWNLPRYLIYLLLLTLRGPCLRSDRVIAFDICPVVVASLFWQQRAPALAPAV